MKHEILDVKQAAKFHSLVTMRVKSPEYKEPYVRQGDMQEILGGAAERQKNTRRGGKKSNSKPRVAKYVDISATRLQSTKEGHVCLCLLITTPCKCM
jgi:hypothetical protein